MSKTGEYPFDVHQGPTGFAKLALTLAWSTASSMFLLSIARVCAAASICFLHSSFKVVMAFCWARRILLISSAMSLFSSFWVPSICREGKQTHWVLCFSDGHFLMEVWHLAVGKAPVWIIKWEMAEINFSIPLFVHADSLSSSTFFVCFGLSSKHKHSFRLQKMDLLENFSKGEDIKKQGCHVDRQSTIFSLWCQNVRHSHLASCLTAGLFACLHLNAVTLKLNKGTKVSECTLEVIT